MEDTYSNGKKKIFTLTDDALDLMAADGSVNISALNYLKDKLYNKESKSFDDTVVASMVKILKYTSNVIGIDEAINELNQMYLFVENNNTDNYIKERCFLHVFLKNLVFFGNR